MSLYVVDSSVVIKWFTPEIHATAAVRLQTCDNPLHAPDFLDVELAVIVWKKMRREGGPATSPFCNTCPELPMPPGQKLIIAGRIGYPDSRGAPNAGETIH